MEDANANGIVDAGETDPLNPDSDGDGFNDGDEVTLGTDPLDELDLPRQVPALGVWGRGLLVALLAVFGVGQWRRGPRFRA